MYRGRFRGRAKSTLRATNSTVGKGLAVLKKYGANAHLWLPGIGYFNGVDLGNYQDSAGTTAALVDNPIGLVLDQGYGGGTVGANLTPSAFTGFTTTAGFSIGDGVLSASAAPANNSANKFLISAGTTYQVTVRCSALSAGSWQVLYEGGTSVFGVPITTPGTFTAIVTAPSSGAVYVWANTTLTATFDQISIRPVLGISASQATAGNRPALRRGVTNLLTYNQDATNAAWVKVSATVTNNAGTAPDGSNTAIRLQTTAANGALQQSCAAANTPFTQITWVKSNNGSNQTYQFWNGSASIQGTATTAWQLVTSGASSFSTGSRFDFGSPTSGADLLIWSPGAAYGALTAAQILAAGGIPLTTSAVASSSAGNWGWQFGGAHYLGLASVPFQMVDDHAVIAGVRPDSGTGYQSIFAINGVVTNPKIAHLEFGGGNLNAYWQDDSGAAQILQTSYALGVPIVATGARRSNTAVLRVNGSQKNITGPAALGATTVSNATIGARGFGPSNQLIGQEYALAAVKGTVSDADLLAIERMIGALTGPTGVIF